MSAVHLVHYPDYETSYKWFQYQALMVYKMDSFGYKNESKLFLEIVIMHSFHPKCKWTVEMELFFWTVGTI